MFIKSVLSGTQQGAKVFDAEYLVVAGGGGGGGGNAADGGGGAGGYRSSVSGESSGGGASAEAVFKASFDVAYTVTVGAGGAGGSEGVQAISGSNSVFSTITSISGGYGGSRQIGSATRDGANGGSGGGGASSAGSGAGGSGTSGQGYAGGDSLNTPPNYGGGGGGGASQAGANGTSTTGGNGGAGVASSITETSVIRAGGGGGGSYDGGTAGSGGAGGGGAGKVGNSATPAGSGTANTGGGGGGAAGPTSPFTGGSGGSGVVILRVPNTVTADFSAGVVYNYIPVDGFHVYEITGAGVSDTVTFIDNGPDAVTVNDSLRFNDDDSAYLSRTPSVASNRKTWTWSGWVKRGNLAGSSSLALFQQRDDVNSSQQFLIQFRNDFIRILDQSSGTNQGLYDTIAVFRDTSSWYHITVACDTTAAIAGDRVKLYVNGKRVTEFNSPNNWPLNYDTSVNNTVRALIGVQRPNSSSTLQGYFDGYLSDVYLIDGEALDPSYFGRMSSDGIWEPIAFRGTSYGTNGFHLDFADNSTAAALGTDVSGNGNDWTPSGITTDDQVSDTPSVNYCTFNPVDKASDSILSNGNLTQQQTSNYRTTTGTIYVNSGKWYAEMDVIATVYGDMAGVVRQGAFDRNTRLGIGTGQSGGYGYNGYDGIKANNGVQTAYGDNFRTDLIGVALDLDNGTLEFFKNGVSQGVAFTGLPDGYYTFATGHIDSTSTWNFGQRPFAYTPPTGFQALNSANLPAPAITDGKEHFKTLLYTGNGTTQSVQGLEFQPDFVWVKERTTTEWHQLYDALRGTGALFSNDTNAELSLSGVSFNSNGFTVSDTFRTNQSGLPYVGWSWNAGGSTVTNNDGTITSQVRANTTAGFSIVTWTSDGSTDGRIGHGLLAAPELIITKNRGGANNWYTVTTVIDGSYDYLFLNTTAAKADVINGTAPTVTTFSNSAFNNGNTMLAYCFAGVDGFSKFGSYTGNGSADGPFVYTGFRPAFVMVKATSVSGESWAIIDDKRLGYNETNSYVIANASSAEFAYGGGGADILSNGFKLRSTSTGLNGSGITFIYMAFAENPFKTARAR